jgi:hypothetical protein
MGMGVFRSGIKGESDQIWGGHRSDRIMGLIRSSGLQYLIQIRYNYAIESCRISTDPASAE